LELKEGTKTAEGMSFPGYRKKKEVLGRRLYLKTLKEGFDLGKERSPFLHEQRRS
jgi:hypothetical protein